LREKEILPVEVIRKVVCKDPVVAGNYVMAFVVHNCLVAIDGVDSFAHQAVSIVNAAAAMLAVDSEFYASAAETLVVQLHSFVVVDAVEIETRIQFPGNWREIR